MTLDDRIPQILERVDLPALVVNEGGGESSRPDTYHCPNPPHEDRKPSFTVKAGRWKCWSACDESGDAIDLLVWLRGMTKAEAIETLAAMVGLERVDTGLSLGTVHRTLSGAANATPDPAFAPDAEPALPDGDLLTRWCRQRGWGPWIVEALGLSLVTDAYGRWRVRFPFRIDARCPTGRTGPSTTP